MRIGFDGKRAFMNASGLGNYSRTLIGSLLEYFPENDYVAFTPGVSGNTGSELTAGKLKVVMPPEVMRTFLSSWWRTSMVSEDIRAHELDVFHGLSNELPKRLPRGVAKVVTIHDLIFLRHPEWYPFIDRNVYFRKFRNACKQADAVVAVSEHTKKDIIHFFNTSEDKIKVVYQACDSRFLRHADKHAIETFRKKRSLPADYILYVGTIEERKNLLTLARALAQVDGIPLVVIGRKKKYFDKVSRFMKENHAGNRIIFPENISVHELPLVFQGASVFVYPSFYEGFGIPVIEALSSRVPVITTSVTALPEAGGDAAIYFNPHDAADLAEKIKAVLGDAALRKRMSEAGAEYVKRFGRKETATAMMDLYKSLRG
jgi:glycosyltransferase involved in cell wall biosynthesis